MYVKSVLIFSCLLLSIIAIGQITNRPFPQHAAYFKGVITPNNISQKEMDDSVRTFYNQWKHRYVKKDECKNGLYIWTEQSTGKNQCVSEGQGYGMLITALFSSRKKYHQCHI